MLCQGKLTMQRLAFGKLILDGHRWFWLRGGRVVLPVAGMMTCKCLSSLSPGSAWLLSSAACLAWALEELLWSEGWLHCKEGSCAEMGESCSCMDTLQLCCWETWVKARPHSSVCPELCCCWLCPLRSWDVVFPLFSCAELQSLEKQLVSAGNGWVCSVLSWNLDTVHEAGQMEWGKYSRKSICEKLFHLELCKGKLPFQKMSEGLRSAAAKSECDIETTAYWAVRGGLKVLLLEDTAGK